MANFFLPVIFVFFKMLLLEFNFSTSIQVSPSEGDEIHPFVVINMLTLQARWVKTPLLSHRPWLSLPNTPWVPQLWVKTPTLTHCPWLHLSHHVNPSRPIYKLFPSKESFLTKSIPSDYDLRVPSCTLPFSFDSRMLQGPSTGEPIPSNPYPLTHFQVTLLYFSTGLNDLSLLSFLLASFKVDTKRMRQLYRLSTVSHISVQYCPFLNTLHHTQLTNNIHSTSHWCLRLFAPISESRPSNPMHNTLLSWNTRSLPYIHQPPCSSLSISENIYRK
jgi:hypothetical protein